MQEQLAITLAPARVTVKAGGAADPVMIQITNGINEIDSYTVEVLDLSPDWYDLEPRSLTLYPKEQKALKLIFKPPASFDTLAGRYDYTIRAHSTVVNARVGQAKGALLVTLPEALHVKLRSKMGQGQEGKFEALVTNRSKTPQMVTLTAADRDSMLEFSFEPATPQIAPGQSLGVELTVRPRSDQILTTERPFQFTVRAQTVDEREQSNKEEGLFTYVPARIRMEFETPRLKGVEARFRLNVSNHGTNPVPVEISAKDPDNALEITFEQESLNLQPNTTLILPLRVRPRAGRKPELRAYPFTIMVRPRGAGSAAPELGPPVTGELVYEPPIEFAITIQQTKQSGPTACEYTVQLANPSPVGLRLSLQAEPPQQALGLFFAGRVDQLLLRPGETSQVVLLARIDGAPPAQAVTYPFRVRAHVIPEDGSAEIDKTATAEFVCAPTDGPPLRVDLLPPQARGEVGRFQVRVTSGVGDPLPVQLRGRDDGNALHYKFEPMRVELAPASVEVVDLVVSLRNGHAPAGQDYKFDVIAWIPGMGTSGATTRAGAWAYTPPTVPVAALALHLDPTHILGGEGQVQLKVVNQGAVPLTVQLRGSDDAEALEFWFQTPRLQLQPQEVKEMSLIVRGREGAPLPGPYRYPFMIAGMVAGMEMTTASLQYGELVVTEAPKSAPIWFPWQRIGMAALLVLWIILPFILHAMFRNNTAMLSLIYMILPAIALPLIGSSLYGPPMSQATGWRRVLAGWLAGSAGFMFILAPLLINVPIPILGIPAAPFITIMLIPALIMILLV